MPDEPNRTRVGDRITIYPRGKKQIYIADYWQDNVHRKVSLKTCNKKVAIERATKLAAGLLEGTFQSTPRAVEFQEACEQYLLALKTEERSRKTLVKYQGVFENFAEFLTRKRISRLHQVTPTMFDAWRAERRGIRKPKTVYTESVVVKQLFRWAKSRKLILEDPLAGIRLNKPVAKPKPAPSWDEVNTILEKAEEPLKTWLTVLAFTGMRVGELQRLRVEDVDFCGNWIHVRSRPGAETKTRDSRKVPIHPRLRAVLEMVPRSKHQWFFTAGPSKKYPQGSNWINPKRVNDQFARLLSRLKLPVGRESGYVIHSLRHFFETYTVNARIPQRVVDTWLGHHSDKSKAVVYYRLTDNDSQKFMAQVPIDRTDAASGSPASRTA